MIKQKIILLMLVLVVLCTQYACKHEVQGFPIDPTDTTGTGVCFQTEILPIFQTNCAKGGCHDAGSREDGYQLDSYTNIVARGIVAGRAANSKIYEVITENSASDIMPPPPNPPLTAEQISKIGTWINEGARNLTNCTSACDTTVFTYNLGVKPILETHCNGCHAGAAASGAGINLDNYAAVKDQVDFNTLYPAIAHTGSSPMPKDAAKLSDCKIAIIRKWIAAGAPNN